MKHYIGVLFLIAAVIYSCKASYNHQQKSELFYTPGKEGIVASDSSIIKEIDPYKTGMDHIMNEVIAVSDQSMEKGLPESNLGDFVADLSFHIINEQLKKTGKPVADFCVLNNGGLRSTLPQGEIKLKDVFELMPFENELVILEMKGNSVENLLQYIASKGGVPVANLRMKILGSEADNVFINGEPFDSSRVYRTITSDYLANGGDGMNMFTEAISSQSSGVKVRDAIINHMRTKTERGESIKVETDGRISK